MAKRNYKEFTYLRSPYQERVIFEYGNTVPTDTEITAYIFDRLIFYYKQLHTYGEHYWENPTDLFEYIIRHIEACSKGRWADSGHPCYNPQMLSYAEELAKKKDLYKYLQARVSYLWELFRLADEGMLPPYIPMTNVFDPENRYADKLKEDYDEDYKRVLFLCGETKYPKQQVRFMDKDATIISVKKGRGWYRCGNIEAWERYYERITK